MLNWIEKLLGRSAAGAEAPLPRWAELMQALLAEVDKLPADKTRPALARDLLAYVLEGEPASVLAELGKYGMVGTALRVTGFLSVSTLPGELYGLMDEIPAPALLRWARLLEACVGGRNTQYYRLQLQNGAHWPEVLLLHAGGVAMQGWTSQRPHPRSAGMIGLEAALVEAGLEPAAVLLGAYATPTDAGYATEPRLQMVRDLRGYAEAVERHLEALRPLLLPAKAEQRAHVLYMLQTVPAATLDRVAAEIAELATSTSKQVRAAADAVVRAGGPGVCAALEDKARQGKPEQRLHALRLLWLLAGLRANQALQARARELALADKAPSVQALIGEWEGRQEAEQAGLGQYEYTVPQLDWSTPLTPAVERILAELWRTMNESVAQINKHAVAHHAAMLAQGRNMQLHQTAEFSTAELAALREFIASGRPAPEKPLFERQRAWRHSVQEWPRLTTMECMSPVLLFKLLKGLSCALSDAGGLEFPAVRAFGALHRASGKPSLLELSLMVEAAGGSAAGVMRNYCRGWGQGLAGDWSDEAVWPFFAHHQELLTAGLAQAGLNDYSHDRSGVFRAVATLPVPPPAVVDALFELALGEGKQDRAAAQKALASQPGKEVRIVAALGHGKAVVRTVAAQWLQQLRHAEAVPALEAAVAKEKHDIAKGALLDALQAFGQPVEKYLDRAALARDAAKSLAKGLPAELDWFPWSTLPEVRWNDSGEAVPHDTLRWLLVQAVKQKSPEPNAVLRKYCAMLEPRGREALGQFVLEAWLGEDVKPIAAEDAQKKAAALAQNLHDMFQRYPNYAQNNPLAGRSVQELTAYYLPGQLRLPAGSASASKGLLAVAAACADQRAAPITARYLKDWYGTRATQGKALIAMLAWIEHPSATQLMLSIGSRFRTKSFQEEATRQAQALAERRNWTLAELADRTIPSAGFDEGGTLELSFGERVFTGKLLPDFKTELYNAEGKKIASLPEPRQDEDAELAQAAKKAWSAGKKELKGIVEQQVDRLYEALCTQREWPYADWEQYLNRHPVVRHLVQRLVWVEMREGQVAQSFRPLDDGTLTDREDNPVELPPEARVRLAHDTLIDAETAAQWQRHLADYAVAPLFQQLGKGSYALPQERRDDTEIKDFEGHMLEAFALRGRALKLGYTRGEAEDGGWFYRYHKRFPTLGLVAAIQFTGSPLPEENRSVALLSLSFTAAGQDRWQGGALALSKVPPVLLSECYQDLRLLAAQGSGYDPDWKKKSEY